MDKVSDRQAVTDVASYADDCYQALDEHGPPLRVRELAACLADTDMVTIALARVNEFVTLPLT